MNSTCHSNDECVAQFIQFKKNLDSIQKKLGSELLIWENKKKNKICVKPVNKSIQFKICLNHFFLKSKKEIEKTYLIPKNVIEKEEKKLKSKQSIYYKKLLRNLYKIKRLYDKQGQIEAGNERRKKKRMQNVNQQIDNSMQQVSQHQLNI